jgi:hypothetical protein
LKRSEFTSGTPRPKDPEEVFIGVDPASEASTAITRALWPESMLASGVGETPAEVRRSLDIARTLPGLDTQYYDAQAHMTYARGVASIAQEGDWVTDMDTPPATRSLDEERLHGQRIVDAVAHISRERLELLIMAYPEWREMSLRQRADILERAAEAEQRF